MVKRTQYAPTLLAKRVECEFTPKRWYTKTDPTFEFRNPVLGMMTGLVID